MPTVKITSGTVVVEMDANECSIGELTQRAVAAVRDVQQAEREANQARIANIGGYL